MKAGFFIIASIILLFYSAINYYIYHRVHQALPDGLASVILRIIIIVGSISFFVGSLLTFKTSSFFADKIYLVGTYWLAYFFYFLLFLVVIDLVRAIHFFVPILPNIITQNYGLAKIYLLVFVVVTTTAIIIAGTFNMYRTQIKNLQLTVNKQSSEPGTLRIAFVSDIHFGAIFGKAFAEKIVREINETKPDLVLIGGDIIDNNIAPIIRKDILSPFKKLQSKYGTYACLGNHDYMGDLKMSDSVIRSNNIILLRDESVCIDNLFYIVSREDRMLYQTTGKRRKPLSDLLVGIDKSKLIILLDHEPQMLSDAQDNHIDLQLSGHTHYGQMFPIGWIVDKIYELGWGYLQKGNTHYYVSCGIGTWGAPVKTGCTSEMVLIELKY